MKAYFIGGGIGSLAGAAFMIWDAGVPGADITILEQLPSPGGSLDAASDPKGGYSLRGARMFTTDHYECLWDLMKTIPSLEHPDQSVYDEVLAFNLENKAHSQARLVDRNRHKVDVSSMNFTNADRVELSSSSRHRRSDLAPAALPTGCLRRSFSRPSGPCGRRHLHFSLGIAPSN